jgi:chorismate-pyruvate lyase
MKNRSLLIPDPLGVDHQTEIEVENVTCDKIPQPYRNLLVHDTRMTSTLESAFDEEMTLNVLSSKQISEDRYIRQVLLMGKSSGLPREYAAIEIFLSRFPPEPTEIILNGVVPFGTILTQFNIPHLSKPDRFFRFQATEQMVEQLKLQTAEVLLYGRQNTLMTPDEEPLAEVIEFLPIIEKMESY